MGPGYASPPGCASAPGDGLHRLPGHPRRRQRRLNRRHLPACSCEVGIDSLSQLKVKVVLDQAQRAGAAMRQHVTKAKTAMPAANCGLERGPTSTARGPAVNKLLREQLQILVHGAQLKQLCVM